MARVVGHGHEALRRGRWSAPGAEYFLTVCVEGRSRGLSDDPLASTTWAQAHQLASAGLWHIRTGTIMPDHLHLLITLGERTPLSEVIRLFKGRLTLELRRAEVRWQSGYFDHRLRDREDRLPLFLYIFLNPYRAHLIAPGKIWPAYYCAPEDWKWFSQLTNFSCPMPEWLERR
jgi:putative transposase